MGDEPRGFGTEPPVDPVVRVVADRAAIRDVLDRYASGVDRRDFEAVARCFAPDVRGRFGGIDHADRDALLAFIRGVSHFDATLHWLGPARIELRGDRARATAPALIAHRLERPDGSLFRYDSNETLYSEELERDGGSWRIVRRDAEPSDGGEGVRGLASADPAAARLLDLAAVDDALLRFGLEQQRERARAGADSSTLLLGLPIVSLAGDSVDVLVTGFAIARTGRIEPGPAARPWSRRWQHEELRCIGWRLRLERRGPAWFDVVQTAEETDRRDALPAAEWPRSRDPVVSRLLARAAIRDVVARRARQDGVADAGSVHRLLGSPMVHDASGPAQPLQVETYCFEIVPGALWGDGGCRLADSIEERDGLFEIVARRRLATVAPDACAEEKR